MKRSLVALGVSILASSAWASHANENMSAVQDSMDVNGTITVSPTGNVISYKLDRPGKLPGYIVQLLNRAIPKWRFYPNLRNGHPFIAKASMDIRLVAKPLSNGKVSIRVDQTTFGTGHEKDDYQIRFKGNSTPAPYPREEQMEGASGVAYVVLMIDRHGQVSKAAVEEVDLETKGPANLMVRWRRDFAR